LSNLLVSLDRLAEFDEVVDVRTPLEYAEDHIPGAINAPVLSNEERAVVGTMYKQVSAHEATRVGAAMVARNIARHLETVFADRPRQWRPLIYCWRGGKRSGSMTTWFNLIGWRARQLEGGYKTYRHQVLQTLETLPGQFRYIVLLGPTGSGKTRMLEALGRACAQALDLEGLARHRGSLLGALPGHAQPSQKGFDTALAGALSKFTPDRPVFVEAESRRIGAVSLPLSLQQAFHQGDCVELDADREERIAFLLQNYSHLFDAPALFKQQLARLTALHGKETIARWHAMIDTDARAPLFGELIGLHYDPAYARSSHAHFTKMTHSRRFAFRPSAPDVDQQALQLLMALGGMAGGSAAAPAGVPCVTSQPRGR
jgi:tRNA 2-selenouridine synthase